MPQLTTNLASVFNVIVITYSKMSRQKKTNPCATWSMVVQRQSVMPHSPYVRVSSQMPSNVCRSVVVHVASVPQVPGPFWHGWFYTHHVDTRSHDRSQPSETRYTERSPKLPGIGEPFRKGGNNHRMRLCCVVYFLIRFLSKQLKSLPKDRYIIQVNLWDVGNKHMTSRYIYTHNVHT